MSKDACQSHEKLRSTTGPPLAEAVMDVTLSKCRALFRTLNVV